MGCFCRHALGPLSLALPSLNVALGASLPNADLVLSLSGWLGARGLPASPWQPDPNWRLLALPQLTLKAEAMATVSALAQLRAQVLAQFGIDLLVPGQTQAFARILATLDARLSAMANVSLDPLPWVRLSGLLGAILRVEAALQAGLLAPSANLALSMTTPGGFPMADWRAFLAALAALVPLIAAAAQLGISLNAAFTASLAAALRMMRGLSLPGLGDANLFLMARLTASLQAVAQLRDGLGLDPLAAGLPAVREAIALRLSALLGQLQARLGLQLSGLDPWAALLALLPPLPYCASSLAGADVVRVALSMHAQSLASMDWQVPPLASLAVLRVGLPACAFAAQLQAALGIQAVLAAPCAAGCDATSTLRAAMAG